MLDASARRGPEHTVCALGEGETKVGAGFGAEVDDGIVVGKVTTVGTEEGSTVTWGVAGITAPVGSAEGVAAERHPVTTASIIKNAAKKATFLLLTCNLLIFIELIKI